MRSTVGLLSPLGAPPPPCIIDVTLLPGIFSGEKKQKSG